MNNAEIDYNLLEVEKGNRRYGIYLKNHIQDLQVKNKRLNNIINTIQQEMENLNDTGIFSIKPKYVWQRIETLKGVDKE